MIWLVIVLVIAALALVIYDVRWGARRRSARARRKHPPVPPHYRSGDPRKRNS